MLWLTIFAFGLLFMSIFLKNILIYIGIIATWCGIVFWTGNDFPEYIRLAALAVVVFAILSINKLRNQGGE